MRKVISKTAQIIDSLSVFAGNLSGIFILIVALSVVYEIALRTFLNRPTSWTLELSIHLTIAATFLGAPYVAKIGRHISVDIITSRLQNESRKALDFAAHSLSLAFLILFSYSTVKLMETSYVSHAVTPALRIPLYIPQSTLLIGSVLLLLQLTKGTIDKGFGFVKRANYFDSTQEKMDPASEVILAKPQFIAYLDKPIVVLIFFLAAITGGCLLLRAGGNLVNSGIILLILVFLFSGMPIFMSIIAVASIGFFILSPGILLSQLALAEAGYSGLEKFELSAIPLFILGGTLVGVGKMSDRLYDFFQVWTSRIPGSLAIASILSCAVFAAMSGSGISGALTIGLIAIPAMISRGYDKGLAIGSVASAGTLGLLIPPSIAMIVYASLTTVSVGKLFIGGVFPGLLIAGLLSIYVLLKCWGDQRYRITKTFSRQEKIRALKRALPALFIPIFLLSSIYTGTATPTEAAGVLVVWSLVLGVLYGEINRSNFWESLRNARAVCSALLMIFVAAHILTLLSARIELPQTIISLSIRSGAPPWAIIVLINLMIMILGMIFESGALMMILTPMLFPLIVSLGYDPLWFGVLFVINIEIAQISPPVGIVIYALHAVLDEKIGTIMRAVIPFILLLALGLLIVGLFPSLVTWLPSKMMR